MKTIDENKCCERDHNGDGNCDRHPKGADHSPLPWAVGSDHPSVCAYEEDWRQICAMDLALAIGEDQANAEFIVRACNSHYDLLEACKDVVSYLAAIEQQSRRIGEREAMASKISKLDAAIRKATGEQ